MDILTEALEGMEAIERRVAGAEIAYVEDSFLLEGEHHFCRGWPKRPFNC